MDRNKIDALIIKSDLVKIAEQAGAKLHHHGAEWRGTCPLHNGSNETAFVIWIADDGMQAFHCFNCGAGGDVIEFIRKWRGLSFPDAVRYLGGEPMSAEHEAAYAIKRAERAAQMAERAAAQARAAIDALKSTEVWQRYHESMTNDARKLWRDRGVPDDFQNLWRLGYCADKRYTDKDGEQHSPSMTIPLFAHGWDVTNVKHRLLHPTDPNDKYRPERSGLTMPAYLCDPDMSKDETKNILIVEGEIKAMVTYLTLDSAKWQVVGLPGKDAKKIKAELAADYKDRNVIVCLDPDGKEQAVELARTMGGRVFTLPKKIDDLITAGAIDKTMLRGIVKQAERV